MDYVVLRLLYVDEKQRFDWVKIGKFKSWIDATNFIDSLGITRASALIVTE